MKAIGPVLQLLASRYDGSIDSVVIAGVPLSILLA
jgi:hypothetical protein